MPMNNNLLRAIKEVRKQIGNGDPNVFLQNFVEKNNVPQNILNQAQDQAKQIMQMLGYK